MAQPGASPKPTWQAPQPTFWERTKSLSSKAYENTLKPGYNKAYAVVDKLGAPVNRLSNKVGSEAFWPTTLDKESEKCARILRTFCKDGFYDEITEEAETQAIADRKDTTVNVPQGKQRVVVKIPAKVIQNAVGLAIFTTMRTGWVMGGSGGAGIVVARHPETREWSPPSGIQVQNLSIGFLIGVDIFDTVLVINKYTALEAFTKAARVTLGTELGVAAGPVGGGGQFDTEIHKKPAPIWSYVKSRGLYAGVALAGNAIIERTDENAKFYGYEVSAKEILGHKVRHPPERDYKILSDTLRAAQGEDIDASLLPSGDAPGDMEIDDSQNPHFGIPAADDDDPFGVKALEAEGLHIREAGTHQRPSAEVFEFNPAPSSPIYNTYRRSMDGGSLKKKTNSWRNSTTSLNSVTRATQTEDAGSRSPNPSGLQNSINSDESISASPPKYENPEEDPIHQAALHEKQDGSDDENEKDHDDEHEHDHDHEHDFSDIDSEAEIATAVTSAVRPRVGVVQVAKALPPALPPRNPGRAPPPQPPTRNIFIVKFRTSQDFPAHKLVLRTSIDNWTKNRTGTETNGIYRFELDTDEFSEDFECKFVLLPNRWMRDPNLLVASPAAGEDITFTDSRVVFDPPGPGDEDEDEDTPVGEMENVDLDRVPGAFRRDSRDDDDAFVSVPPTPDLQEGDKQRINGY